MKHACDARLTSRRVSHWLAAAACLSLIAAACGDDDDAAAGTTAGTAAPAAGTTTGGTTGGCEPIKVAMNDSPQNRAVSYAIDEGIVTSDVVDVSVGGLPVAGLIEEAQSFSTYDIVEATPNGLAFGIANGAPLVAVGPGQVGKGTDGRSGAVLGFSQADSEYTSFADLKGATIAVVGLGATTTQLVGIVLNGAGVDPAVEGGDVTWQELPHDQQPVALANGDVDVIGASHLGAYLSLTNPEVRFIGAVDDEYRALSGGSPPVLSVLLTLEPKVAGNEACYVAARQLIAESYDYAVEHIAEVAPAVAANYEGADPTVVEPFVTAWITEWMDYVGDPTAEDVAAIQKQTDLGAAAGMNPPLDVATVMLNPDGVGSGSE